METRPDDTPPAATSAYGAGGPRVDARQQLHDIDALRRSRDDRLLAGVAGGLGRHFDIDPTIVRVLFAVAALFGGAGLLAYVALWLLVPRDGEEHARIGVRGSTRRYLLFLVVAVACIMALGNVWRGWHGFWVPLAVLAVIALILTDRDRRQSVPGSREPAPSLTGDADERQPAVSARTTPQRPSGQLLFWPTIALLAVCFGVLAVIDLHHSVAVAAYPALALGVIGVMLLVGAFVGRPGGLVALGMDALLPLGPAGVLGDHFSFRGTDTSPTPRTAAAVLPAYDIGTGRVRLDLTRVSDPSALAGRTVHVRADVGEAEILLPAGVNAHIVGSVHAAGGLDLGPLNTGGVGGVTDSHDFAGGPPGQPPLTVRVDVRVGHIQVIPAGVEQ